VVEEAGRDVAPPGPARRRRWLVGPALCLGILLSLELAARLVTRAADFERFGQRVRARIETGSQDFDACLATDPELFWRIVPDRTLPRVGRQPFFGLISNHEGLRGPEVGDRKPGVLRILVLGDSCAFGFGLEAEEAWPARLATHLQAAGCAAEVLNAGVPGYTSMQGVVLAGRLMPRLQPDLVLVAFGWNDSSIWDGLTDRQQLIASKQREEDRIPLLERSRAYLLLRKLTLQGLRALRGREALPPRVPPAEFAENLATLARMAHAAGAYPLLVAWPFRDQLADPTRPRTAWQERMAVSGLPLVDLVAEFREQGSPDLFLDEGHANAAGADLAAQAIARAVLAAR
jgi:lysophospholipase L1-like esterase